MADNILQSTILAKFVYPFLLVFFIVFAILEKTKVFGEKKPQLNAMVALIIGLIFVTAVSPKLIVGDLILFLSVALVVVFIVLLLWGFITGEEAKFSGSRGLKIGAGIVVVAAVIITLFLVTDVFEDVIDFLFDSDWSEDVWTNVVFIVLIAAALAVVIGSTKAKS